MSEITAMPLPQLAGGLAAGDFSAEEVVRAFAARIAENAELNAFVDFDESRALEAAKNLRLDSKDSGGALAGVPVALKDLFCAGRTTCGSKMLANFHAPYEAAVAAHCHRAGMPLLGKTNMDEFAMGSSGEHSHFGQTLNPWNHAHVPGGSSSGSAAAVAARLSPVAVGSDTGGSVRQPAAFCGVCGIKPTYGAISRYGMTAFASSFDQAGVFGGSAEDCAWLLNLLAVYDPRDSTSDSFYKTPLFADPQDPAYGEKINAALSQSIKGKKIGVARDFFGEGLSEQTLARLEDALRVYESLGAEVLDVPLKLEAAVPAYYVLTGAEAASNLARYDGVRCGHRETAADEELRDFYSKNRAAGFGLEVKRRIITGAYVLSYGYHHAYYRLAMKVRQRVADAFAEVFSAESNGVEIVIAPTAPGVAFRFGAHEDPVAMYRQDVFTVPASLAGLPAMSIPCGFDDNFLPIGMQLIAPRRAEKTILNFAHAYQTAADFHKRRPPEKKQ